MPTFRQAPFLPRALRSLLDQQLPDWELLVVDDASPDETPTVLAPFLGDAASGPCAWSATWAPGPPSIWPPPWPGGATSPTSPRTTSTSRGTCSVSWRTWRAPGRLPGLRGSAGARLPWPHPAGGRSRGRGAGRLSRPYPGRRRWDSPAGTCWPSYQVCHRREWEEVRWATGRRPSPTAWRRTSGGPSCPAGPLRLQRGRHLPLGRPPRPAAQDHRLGADRQRPRRRARRRRPGAGRLPRLLRGRSGEVPQLAPLRRGPFRRSLRLRRTGRPRDLPAPGGYGSSWPASWASTPSASWPSRSGGTSCSASGCATPSSGTPGPFHSGTSRRSHSRGLAGAGAGRPP